MGALTVRLPDSLHEKVREVAEKEGISMNQLVMLVVSEKITRLDAEAQFAHLDALERLGEGVAEKEDVGPDELMVELLGRAGDKKVLGGRSASCRGKIGEESLPERLGFKGGDVQRGSKDGCWRLAFRKDRSPLSAKRSPSSRRSPSAFRAV
jgi:predicted transcriptional regulator